MVCLLEMESTVKARVNNESSRDSPCSLTCAINNTPRSYTLARKHQLEVIDNQAADFKHSLKEVTCMVDSLTISNYFLLGH